MTVTWVLPFTLQNGQVADADQVMANFNAGVAALTGAAASGANNDITALLALTTPITPAQGGTSSYYGFTSTGTNTVVVSSIQPSGWSNAAGKRIVFIAGFTNTGATTLDVVGVGAKNVFRMTPSGPQACTGGEIVAGTLVDAVYDGTQFQLVDVVAQFGGAGPVTGLASGTTTDLGTIASHLVTITGVTTIASFGSSASITYPFYWIGFQSALTLTYNATSMILPGAADIVTAAGDSALAAYAGSGNWQVLFYQRAASAPYRRKAPTYQDLTSGSSATYTAPTPRPAYLKVRAVGGGGGGGSGGGNGGVGGTTTFNSVTAIGGSGGVAHIGAAYGTGGAGGTAGSGTAQLRVPGGNGQGGSSAGGDTTSGAGPGGAGGGSAFFGGGGGNVGQVSTAGATNTGGGGAGVASVAANQGGDGGGGGGEYFELIIDNPAATYTYTVGAAGTAAAGGVTGAAGRIVVEEFYN